MNTLKAIGYVFLAIVVITVLFSVGAFVSFIGFVLSVVITGALFIGFIAFLIKAYFDLRK